MEFLKTVLDILIGNTILFGGSYLPLIFKTAGGIGIAGVGVSGI